MKNKYLLIFSLTVFLVRPLAFSKNNFNKEAEIIEVKYTLFSSALFGEKMIMVSKVLR